MNRHRGYPKQAAAGANLMIERVQTGVRIADYHHLSLGDLIEGIVLHSFEGKFHEGVGDEDESLPRHGWSAQGSVG